MLDFKGVYSMLFVDIPLAIFHSWHGGKPDIWSWKVDLIFQEYSPLVASASYFHGNPRARFPPNATFSSRESPAISGWGGGALRFPWSFPPTSKANRSVTKKTIQLFLGPCPKTASQRIVKVNRDRFTKMNTLFTNCYTVNSNQTKTIHVQIFNYSIPICANHL